MHLRILRIFIVHTLAYIDISLRGTKKSQFRSYRRIKANKRLCREKKPVCALPDEEKPVSLVSDEKKPVCAVPGRKITTNGILRVKTLIKNISEITRDTNYIWICAGGYCGTTLHQFCRYVTLKTITSWILRKIVSLKIINVICIFTIRNYIIDCDKRYLCNIF